MKDERSMRDLHMSIFVEEAAVALETAVRDADIPLAVAPPWTLADVLRLVVPRPVLREALD